MPYITQHHFTSPRGTFSVAHHQGIGYELGYSDTRDSGTLVSISGLGEGELLDLYEMLRRTIEEAEAARASRKALKSI